MVAVGFVAELVGLGPRRPAQAQAAQRRLPGLEDARPLQRCHGLAPRAGALEDDVLEVELAHRLQVGRQEHGHLARGHGAVAHLQVLEPREAHRRLGRHGRQRRHRRRDFGKQLAGRARRPEERRRPQRQRARAGRPVPRDAQLLEAAGERADVVVDDLEVVEPRLRPVEVPAVDDELELADLRPPAAGGRRGAQAGHVAEVEQRGGVHGAQRQLLQPRQRRPLDRHAQAHEGVIDGVAAVALRGLLVGAAHGQVAQVRHARQGADEGRYVGSGVEDRGVLLREDVAQVGRGEVVVEPLRGVLGPPRRGAARLVEELDLAAVGRTEQRRQEGRRRVGHGEGQLLDVMSDARQRLHARGPRQGAGREGQTGMGEERRRRQSTALGGREAQRTQGAAVEVGEESGADVIVPPGSKKGGVRRRHRGRMTAPRERNGRRGDDDGDGDGDGDGDSEGGVDDQDQIRSRAGRGGDGIETGRGT